MKLIADTHCHSIASTHAYSTITEIARAAYAAGLEAVAVTDHGKAMPGAPGPWYFGNLHSIPPRLEGVALLKGIEANVVDFSGRLDEPEDLLQTMEWVVASMHEGLLPPNPDQDAVTEAWLAVAKKPFVNVIGHSGSAALPYDYDRVVGEFGRLGKLVEINEGTFRVRASSVPNCAKIVKACKRRGVPVVVNSDAHFHTAVGRCENALRLLAELEFPEELVVNAEKTRFFRYVQQFKGINLE